MKGLVVVRLALQDVAVALNSLIVGGLEEHHLHAHARVYTWSTYVFNTYVFNI